MVKKIIWGVVCAVSLLIIGMMIYNVIILLVYRTLP
jgi:hypothetical protein